MRMCPTCKVEVEKRGFMGVCPKCGTRTWYERFPEKEVSVMSKSVSLKKGVERVEELTKTIINNFLYLNEVLSQASTKEFRFEEPRQGNTLAVLIQRYEDTKRLERQFVSMFLNFDNQEIKTFATLLYAFCGALGVDPPTVERRPHFPLTDHLTRLREKVEARLVYLEAVHNCLEEVIRQVTGEVFDEAEGSQS